MVRTSVLFLFAAVVLLLLSGCRTGYGVFTGASGNFTYEVPDDQVKTTTSAYMFRFQTEDLADEEVRGGVRFEVSDVDDDLFEDLGQNAQDFRLYDIHPFLNILLGDRDSLSVVLRAGPYYLSHELRDRVVKSDRRKWKTYGARITVEPRFKLDRRLHLFGEGSAGRGFTRIHDETAVMSDRAKERSVSYGYRAGVRLVPDDDAFVEVAYFYRSSCFNESDDFLQAGTGAFLPETKTYFRGVALSLGIRF